ncbi:uncharacterized protein Tco025E_04732 [Trypanosoma conorhini]|uniref:Arf3-interacting protein 1 N-terminal domain-containing protein n=1 Tax=Trypanosoma conorhini TaxID=83891 RepID=A0A422PJA1_9TRYP|nr:uncharacterized protein Tco025E_04732 [Trypanosoma conorhini]RNF17789.1 hypothetical protein Tco025E_04732 [Trypanosoma conorhini]
MGETDVGDAGVPIAYCVLLAEFDVDTGSCLRAKYPSAPPRVAEAADVEGNKLCGVLDESGVELEGRTHRLQLDEDYCASHMLPDGAEKQMISRTIFIVNRTKPVDTHRLPVYSFTLPTSTHPRELETGPLCFRDEWEWTRDTAPAEVFIPEELNYNRATGEVCVRRKGAVVWGPVTVQAADEFQVCPTIPKRVASFAQQLQQRLDPHNAEVAGVRGPRESDMAPFANIPLTSSTVFADYSFLVHHVGSAYNGFLMLSTQLEPLLIPKKESQLSSGGGGTTTAEEEGEPASEPLKSAEISHALPLYGLCAVVTRKDFSVRRGGISKSVALLGPKLVWLESFFPLLVETALHCCDIKGKTEEAIEQQRVLVGRCFEAVEAATLCLRRGIREMPGNSLEREVMHLFATSGRQTHVTCALSPFGSTHNLRIPLFPAMYDFDFSRYGLEQMVEVCGASFWTLVMAILLEKRVVVLSRQGLPNDVCEAALSLGLIGSLLDPNFLTTKVFPYTSVNGFPHFSHVPGYVVGTLNPIFETQQTWWDVLCDLDNRCVLLSSEANSSGSSPSHGGGAGSAGGKAGGWAAQDAQFARNILSRVYRMRAMRKPSCERHQAVRLMVEEYLALTIMVGEVDRRILSRVIQNSFFTPNLARLRALVQGVAILRGALERFLLPGEDPSLVIAVATLRRASSCDEMELLQTLSRLLSYVCSCKEVILLLRRMPLALEGLNPLAAQLLHTSPLVRQAALELMRRVEVFPPGRAAIAAMNSFLCMVYEAASRDA